MKNKWHAKLSKLALSLILGLTLMPLVGPSMALAADDGDTSALTSDEGVTNPAVDPDDEGITDPEDDPDLLPGDDTEGLEEDPAALDDPEAIDDPELDPDAMLISPLAGPDPVTPYSLEYRAHAQAKGWMNWVKGGKTAGTIGKGLRLEALQLKLNGSGLSGSVQYRFKVQGSGWQDWVKNGKTAGTTGKGLRVEAVQIKLTGELANTYDIRYSVHVQHFGWLGFAYNGDIAGTSGYGYRIEAIQVYLDPKGPPLVGNPFFIKKPMDLESRAHVQSKGWMAWTTQGKTAGTTGKGLRMEALSLKLTSKDYSGSVEYRSYVNGKGWQPWVKDGAKTGTTGQARAMEAVQIKLSGKMATYYDVYYRAYVAKLGWMGWTKNGASAGTKGLSNRMEALQVKLVLKGGKAPGSTATPYLTVTNTSQANVSGKGWLSEVSGRGVVGTTGQGRQLEALKMTVGGTLAGGIEYNAYVKGTEWQGWKKNGAVAGTEGKNKRIEAIKIRLTGDMADKYDIYYRAHTSKWGWLGWAKNGAKAGTGKVGLPMEAYQVAIVLKGSPAPGSTANAYCETDPIPATWRAMNMKINGYTSPTQWLIAIDTGNCLFGVYQGSKGNWTNKYMWGCSPGKPSTPTVKGTFHVGSRGYVFGSGFSCYYWTQITGDYLMHSPLYYPGTRVWMEGTMGVQASHGCVRLEIQNAKWIYDTIPSGTTIVIW